MKKVAVVLLTLVVASVTLAATNYGDTILGGARCSALKAKFAGGGGIEMKIQEIGNAGEEKISKAAVWYFNPPLPKGFEVTLTPILTSRTSSPTGWRMQVRERIIWVLSKGNLRIRMKNGDIFVNVIDEKGKLLDPWHFPGDVPLTFWYNLSTQDTKGRGK